LTSLENGLLSLHCLKELYLACNRIESIKGVFPVPSQLMIIDLSTNGLASLVTAESLTELEEFWISGSKISTFDDLLPLTKLEKFKCIYLEHSPIAKDYEYRQTITKMFPTLTQLDATAVRR
jgi:Leucine-rich repeat (LRR) protein